MPASLAATTMSPGAVTESRDSIQIDFLSDFSAQLSNTSLPELQDEVVSEENTTIRINPAEWSESLNKRFHELAVIDSLGETNEQEKFELEHLQSLRRQLVSPRTGAEIIQEYQMRQQTKNVIRALDDYFKFVGIYGANKKR
ncbi:hypothetical protein [Phragmitibacter flavus]|uniref:hypothetical protein n=1 Tax=Phragmitibacter flavus TaxID=2576071 RepID=UPI0010FF55D6|nr:hypothetical protein [Phragmitibacter flavus]